VRDAATLAGKRVRFAFDGADVRIDGQVLATLHGALVQLVRNAVVHGIETPAERAAAGKPAEGRVALVARAHGPTISVVCEDDGRGLDLVAIRAAAERGGQRAAAGLDAGALFQLLLRGGISTATEVTQLSGRGIGLDLVRDAVQALGGAVAVTTGPGGTTVTLTVPVSVTAIAAVHVVVADRVVAIPRAAVRRITRVAPSDRIDAPDGARLADGEGGSVPCAPLAALIAPGRPAESGHTAVFVDGGGAVAAFTVDRTLGIEEVVVRALPPRAPIDAIIAGMALDAEGVPYPVIEPRALVAAVRRATIVPVPAPRRLAPILVVDDSPTTRMLEQSILESAGYEVELAISAEDALARLERGMYAMLLVDVEMPGLDGIGLVRQLRATPALAALPAVLVTSRDSEVDRRRGTDAGAQGYIVKGDFDQGELLTLIASLVGR
jgi:two-component system chemotaxis sensor kinase CheA